MIDLWVLAHTCGDTHATTCMSLCWEVCQLFPALAHMLSARGWMWHVKGDLTGGGGGRREEKESKNRQRDTMQSGEGEIIVDRMVEGSQKTGRWSKVPHCCRRHSLRSTTKVCDGIQNGAVQQRHLGSKFALKYKGFVHLCLRQMYYKVAFFFSSDAQDITTSRAIKSKRWCSNEKQPHAWKLLSWLHEKSVFCPPVHRWCSLHNSGKAHSWANISIFKAAATVAKLTAGKNNLAPGPPSLQPCCLFIE